MWHIQTLFFCFFVCLFVEASTLLAMETYPLKPFWKESSDILSFLEMDGSLDPAWFSGALLRTWRIHYFSFCWFSSCLVATPSRTHVSTRRNPKPTDSTYLFVGLAKLLYVGYMTLLFFWKTSNLRSTLNTPLSLPLLTRAEQFLL